jgi:thioredoxin-like negative regulator of GroEL
MEILEQMKASGNAEAYGLAAELEQIAQAYANGEISQEERDYLLAEVRDVKAAQVIADREVVIRQVYEAVSLIAKVV